MTIHEFEKFLKPFPNSLKIRIRAEYPEEMEGEIEKLSYETDEKGEPVILIHIM